MANQIFRISKACCTPFTGDVPKKDVFGGKGAGLHDMVAMGLNVPPAFILGTRHCKTYLELVQTGAAYATDVFLDTIMEKAAVEDAWLEDVVGYAPLVAVRSGAPVSMPGMMDTILNVGLTAHNIHEWIARIGERAAWDSYRRLVQMLGATAYGIDMGRFDDALAEAKKAFGAAADTDLTAAQLKTVVLRFFNVFTKETGGYFPDTRSGQLRAAIGAVFRSWMNPRAVEYRKINGISDAMGTAVTVQAMVFGNMGDTSATGVLFSRDPSTGEPGAMGEFLVDAQGEDVVAGIRTPDPLDAMPGLGGQWPGVHSQILETLGGLEDAYLDMVDVEFTVQDGELFILQSRIGKRSAPAAFQIAVDLVQEGTIDRAEAFKRLTRAQFKAARRPMVDPDFKGEPFAVGLPACPGVVTGRVVLTAEDAVKAEDAVILVRDETDPDDIAGMNKAVGVLTATGGATSHAAVVARAMDKACVVGCTALHDTKLSAGDIITIDGASGKVWKGAVPVVDGSGSPALRMVANWALEALGAVETAVVDTEEDAGYRVMASEWWGSVEAADAVLSGLALLPSREAVSLDISGPMELSPPEDGALMEAFGGDPGAQSKAFGKWLLDTLLGMSHQLQGLTVTGARGTSVALLRQAGYRLPRECRTVADLMTGDPVQITPTFVTDVAGGPEAFGQLLEALAKAGHGVKPVPAAVHPDFAALSMLKA